MVTVIKLLPSHISKSREKWVPEENPKDMWPIPDFWSALEKATVEPPEAAAIVGFSEMQVRSELVIENPIVGCSSQSL